MLAKGSAAECGWDGGDIKSGCDEGIQGACGRVVLVAGLEGAAGTALATVLRAGQLMLRRRLSVGWRRTRRMTTARRSAGETELERGCAERPSRTGDQTTECRGLGATTAGSAAQFETTKDAERGVQSEVCSEVCSERCAVRDVQCSVSNARCAVSNARCAVFSVQCAVCSVQCEAFSARCSMRGPCEPRGSTVENSDGDGDGDGEGDGDGDGDGEWTAGGGQTVRRGMRAGCPFHVDEASSERQRPTQRHPDGCAAQPLLPGPGPGLILRRLDEH
ncbi:uncharacterized protein M421DRAFT_220626 [Didymella exigua CBS 183.55]|uniref:Uncharacterized protein n=1 Tax=Didymella exigua CBS 183.55 TaxID=1150837 RepID=A0A6A5RGG2_9PLEO|nr:uncharacterized protein M421DRAFT_220626 [Didymella exigua CBS 183.55]KAF1926248.1 hypothetical protein M421DRAFT_220626 [Didymella exigua CBS 183.55]